MKEINVNIFFYSIGLAILLVGLNILVDTEFVSKEIKILVGTIFTILGLFLLVISLKIK